MVKHLYLFRNRQMKRIKITESQLRMIMEREDIFVSPQSDEEKI